MQQLHRNIVKAITSEKLLSVSVFSPINIDVIFYMPWGVQKSFIMSLNPAESYINSQYEKKLLPVKEPHTQFPVLAVLVGCSDTRILQRNIELRYY